MMRPAILACLPACLALAGCSHAIPVYIDAPVTKAPANVTVACDAVGEPPPRGASMGQLYIYTGDLLGQYEECAMRDQAKLNFIRSQKH